MLALFGFTVVNVSSKIPTASPLRCTTMDQYAALNSKPHQADNYSNSGGAVQAIEKSNMLLKQLEISKSYTLPNKKRFRPSAKGIHSRQQIHSVITRHLGIRYRQLLRETKLPNGSLSYHLKILLMQKEIKSRKAGLALWLFPVEIDELACRIVSETSQPTTIKIISMLLSQIDGATFGQIEDEIQRSSSTIHYHLSRLQNADLVFTTRNSFDRKVSYNLRHRERILPSGIIKNAFSKALTM